MDPAAHGKRRTWQRAAVAAALQATDEFVSAQQLHARLQESGDRVGLATVYRALQSMAEDGDVDVLRNPDGESTYRRCSADHHHHLTCRRCGRTVEIDAVATEEWVRSVGRSHGFDEVEHVIELFGRCTECAARGA
jgi:Fur family ferric uptake transcriptional regulator